MKLGKLLRCYREVNRESIRDLSKEIGITIATLSRIENGKPVDLKITLVLINWLFGGQKSLESPNTASNKRVMPCSMCDVWARTKFIFCPACGAKIERTA
jgi:transcriptional regulator with XRE-family HTH domain